MGGKSSKPFVPVNLINNNEITKEQYEALKSFFESTNIEVKTNVKDGKKNIIKTESKTLAAALGVVFGEDGNITVPQGDVKSIDIAVQDNDTLKQNLETLRSSFGITLDALKSDRGGCGLVGKIFKLLSVSIQGQQEYKFLTKSEKITADKIKEVLEELKKVKVQEVIVLNNKEPGAAYENQDKKNQEIVLPKDQYGNNILGKHTNNQGQVGANNQDQVGANNQDQVGANNEKPEGAGKNPNKENNTLEQCKEDDRFKTFLSYLITNLECFKIDDDEGRFYFDVCLKKQPNNETMFSKMDNNEKGMFYCYNNNDEKIFITTENWQTILEKVKIRSSNSPVQEQVNRINGLIGEWKNKQNNKQNLNNNKEVGANNEKEGAVENPKKEEEKKEEENPEGGENKEEENPNQVGGESQDNNQNLEGGEENNNKEGAVENEKRRNGVGNLKITNIIDTLEILKPNKSSKSLTHIKLENLGEADIHFKSKNNQNKEEEKLKDKDNKEENKENQEDKEEKEKDKKLKNPVAGKAENNNKEGAVENPVGVGENNKDNNNKKELKDLSEGKGTLEKDIEALKSAKEEAEKKMEELNEVLDILNIKIKDEERRLETLKRQIKNTPTELPFRINKVVRDFNLDDIKKKDLNDAMQEQIAAIMAMKQSVEGVELADDKNFLDPEAVNEAFKAKVESFLKKLEGDIRTEVGFDLADGKDVFDPEAVNEAFKEKVKLICETQRAKVDAEYKNLNRLGKLINWGFNTTANKIKNLEKLQDEYNDIVDRDQIGTHFNAFNNRDNEMHQLLLKQKQYNDKYQGYQDAIKKGKGEILEQKDKYNNEYKKHQEASKKVEGILGEAGCKKFLEEKNKDKPGEEYSSFADVWNKELIQPLLDKTAEIAAAQAAKTAAETGEKAAKDEAHKAQAEFTRLEKENKELRERVCHHEVSNVFGFGGVVKENGFPSKKVVKGRRGVGVLQEKGFTGRRRVGVPQEKGFTGRRRVGVPQEKGFTGRRRVGVPQEKGFTGRRRMGFNFWALSVAETRRMFRKRFFIKRINNTQASRNLKSFRRMVRPII